MIRKDILSTVVGIGLVVPLVIILCGWVVQLIHGKFDLFNGNHLLLFSVFFLLMITPFPVISYYKTRKKYKEMAYHSGAKITIDLKYHVLHQLFNPMIELIFSLSYVAIMLILIVNFHLAFIHVVLLWLFYGMARGSKFQVKPSLKDNYIYVFVFLTINQLLLIYYLIKEITCCYTSLSQWMLVAGIILTTLLVIKQLYYFSNLPGVIRRLS